MKYEIVEFKSENIHFDEKTFGIRRRNFFENLFNYGGDYLDFQTSYPVYFWKSRSSNFKDCKTKDANLVFYKYSQFTNNVVEKIIK
jgi:hypothetical protein